MNFQLITDDDHGQHLIYNNAWHKERRQYGCFFRLQVSNDGKIWVRHDATGLIVAEKLVELGVPRQDIVLGYHASIIRPDAGFAVA